MTDTDNDTTFIETLKILPREQRAPIIANEIRDKLASILGSQADSIDNDAPFSRIAPALNDVLIRWSEIIEPWVRNRLGFRYFHLYEASLSNTINELALYLAAELDPVPVPTKPLDDENTPWHWGWSEPKPFQGNSQVQGNTALVLGVGRSGTSLFRSMLACHENIYAPDELHLMNFDNMGQRRSEIQRLWLQWMDIGLTETLTSQFGMSRWEAILKIRQLSDDRVPIEKIYELIHSKLSGAWLIDKTPSYSKHPLWLNRAEQMFEQPKYLFITRHPYAVMDSFIRSRFYRFSADIWGPYSDNPWHSAELYWTTTNRNILEFLKTIPHSRWMRISYEDLMHDTEQVQQSTCQFLSITHEGKILDPYSQPGHDISVMLKERNRLETDNADTWPEKRPPHELSKLTCKIAEELGYALP